MKARVRRPWDVLLIAAAPLMILGLALLYTKVWPWWFGVAVFGVSVLLITAFLAGGYLHLRNSRGGLSLAALLHLAAATVGLVMGCLSIWLASMDFLTGQLNDVGVTVSRQMGKIGVGLMVLGAIAVLTDPG